MKSDLFSNPGIKVNLLQTSPPHLFDVRSKQSPTEVSKCNHHPLLYRSAVVSKKKKHSCLSYYYFFLMPLFELALNLQTTEELYSWA